MNLEDKIKALGTAETAGQLNNIYDELLHLIDITPFDASPSRSEVERALNHIANYNLVRIANAAYEGYLASGKTGVDELQETILLCRDSLKDHEDVDTERSLLDGLSEQLQSN